MKKSIILLATLTISTVVYSQVGINNDNPKATLDITAKTTDATKAEGIIAPRLLGDQIKGKDLQYDAPQKGAIVYATSAVNAPSAKTINITAEGYYYFDGSIWKKFGNETEPWYNQADGTQATSNTQNIYQTGRVAINKATTDKQLEVAGDIKATYNGSGVHSFFDTNFSGIGEGSNMLASADSEDLNTASKANMVYTNNIAGITGFSSKNGTYKAEVAGTSLPGVSSAQLRSANDSNQYQSVIGANTTIGVELYDNLTSGLGLGSRVTINRAEGVRFRFFNSSGANEGQYIFPRNNGSVNQVLTTNGNGTAAALSWKDVSSLAPEPWQVQGGTTAATANTQNIYQAGSVSIGSSMPIAPFTSNGSTITPKLSVSGDVAATGAFYTTTGKYADYVFEDYFDGTSKINSDYNFRSLTEVAAYVKANKHLPGVTAIKDVLKTKDGYTVNLSELSIQQLEKIEELYLYTIEQEEKIAHQKSEINQLKLRMEKLEQLLLKQTNN
ncbi:hypothetical protein [Chryseobacterium sp. FH2]|uniref:hypothetical protein n=1 Tax=Chryseobacterium sp. FH2 TaxID=1674291 RepID=UPI00069E82A7|nr:hypothetical protein [Chryseobacterium sp. FH2]